MRRDSASGADARAWLERARSNLAIASATPVGALFEDLCFEAQQAAEKAIKAVLIWRSVVFPFVHDLAALLSMVPRQDLPLPPDVASAARLTQFAVLTRYPGVAAGPVSEAAYQDAVRMAEAVVQWAEDLIQEQD